MKLPSIILWASALITLGGCSVGVIGDGYTSPTGPTRGANGVCPYDVTRGDPNSWLLVEPELHLVYWGNYPANDQATYQFAWDALLNQETVLQRLSEYGVRGGSFDRNLYNNNPNNVLPNADGGAPTHTVSKTDAGTTILLDDGQFPAEINNEILAGELPYPNDNTVYMIMLPPNTTTPQMVANDDAGYHANSSYNGQRYTYGIIGYRGADFNGTDEVISHELAEAATDPNGNGYRDYTPGHNFDEVADICVWVPVSYGFYGYVVQKYFIQSVCQCQ